MDDAPAARQMRPSAGGCRPARTNQSVSSCAKYQHVAQKESKVFVWMIPLSLRPSDRLLLGVCHRFKRGAVGPDRWVGSGQRHMLARRMLRYLPECTAAVAFWRLKVIRSSTSILDCPAHTHMSPKSTCERLANAAPPALELTVISYETLAESASTGSRSACHRQWSGRPSGVTAAASSCCCTCGSLLVFMRQSCTKTSGTRPPEPSVATLPKSAALAGLRWSTMCEPKAGSNAKVRDGIYVRGVDETKHDETVKVR